MWTNNYIIFRELKKLYYNALQHGCLVTKHTPQNDRENNILTSVKPSKIQKLFCLSIRAMQAYSHCILQVPEQDKHFIEFYTLFKVQYLFLVLSYSCDVIVDHYARFGICQKFQVTEVDRNSSLRKQYKTDFSNLLY